MIVISPWSKESWVCSEVFDHTSIIRFMEKRFGVMEPNISPWRRSVCGDLTSAFHFENPNGNLRRLPSVAAFAAPQSDMASSKTYPNAPLSAPAAGTMPVQELDLRLARPLPYTLQADGRANIAARTFTLNFSNAGSAGACFHVRSPNGSSAEGTPGPGSYMVESGKSLSDIWVPSADGSYELTVNGPNGFFRKFGGNLAAGSVYLAVTCFYDESGITPRITNNTAVAVDVTDTYTGQARSHRLAPGATTGMRWWLNPSHNWYDLIVSTSANSDFVRQYAGHVENGEPSVSDPKNDQVPDNHPHYAGWYSQDHSDGEQGSDDDGGESGRGRGRGTRK